MRHDIDSWHLKGSKPCSLGHPKPYEKSTSIIVYLGVSCIFLKKKIPKCSGAGLPASEAELQIIERTRLAQNHGLFLTSENEKKKPDPCPFTWSFLTNVSGFTSLTNVLHLSKIKRCKLPEVDRQKRIFKQMLPPPCDESLGCVRETLIDQHLSLFDLFAQLESELHDSDIQVLSISIYDDSQVIH